MKESIIMLCGIGILTGLPVQNVSVSTVPFIKTTVTKVLDSEYINVDSNTGIVKSLCELNRPKDLAVLKETSWYCVKKANGDSLRIILDGHVIWKLEHYDIKYNSI